MGSSGCGLDAGDQDGGEVRLGDDGAVRARGSFEGGSGEVEGVVGGVVEIAVLALHCCCWEGVD